MSIIALPVAELKPALSGLGKIIGRKSSLPILNHIKVERTAEGWIALSANNLEQSATVRLEQPAEGNPCSMLIPMEDLQRITKACSRYDTITVRSEERASEASVIIQYPIGQQQVETKVESLPVEEFPEIPRIAGKPIPVPDTLRISLLQALECSSEDETRFVLNGAFIDVSQNSGHYVVGTDGRKLYSSNSFSLPLESSMIIPSHSFLGWKEFNSDGEWQLQVHSNDTPVFAISTRRWIYTSKQIEGNYPNWRQVIPSADQFKTTVVLDQEALDSAIQMIQRLPNYDDTNFAIGLKVEKKRVSLIGRSAQSERWNEVDLNVRSLRGSDAKIFFNRHTITTALKFGLNIIEIIDGISPMRISSAGRQMIIMPIRASDPPPAPAVEPPASTPAQETPEPEPPTEERSPMINDTNAGTVPATTSDEPESEIDQVLEFLEDLRESLTANLVDLKGVTAKVRQMKKDRKSTEKEIQSFRQTLASLQRVKL